MTAVVSLAEHVGSRLGDACGGVELVADRRGSRVYRLRFATGDVALKLATHNAEEQGVREAEHLARRETAVLTHLHEFHPGYLIDSGDLDGDDSPTHRDTILHTAPETAAHILATPDDQPITIDETAEVYALAAVIHLAWTGLSPTTYTHDHAPWRDKLKDIARGRHHDLLAIRPWPWPPFENALRHALTPEPENRIPSMTRFRDTLSSVSRH